MEDLLGLLVWLATLALLFVTPAYVVARFAVSSGERFWPWFIVSLPLWPVTFIVLLFIRRSERRRGPAAGATSPHRPPPRPPPSGPGRL